jgi:hypothetical protein
VKLKYVIASVALAVAAVGIGIAQSFDPDDRAFEISAAITAYEANEARADSAPQQQVVNGWAARDLLEIQAGQLADIHAAQQWQMLVTALAGLAAALGATAVASAISSRPETPAPQSPPAGATPA